ncbi:hypothetical protein LZC95_21615 [Pendulispora brunnea]|uniref:Uncharacterized protein n=1 Tax=Pendulispora brunnea TaxID=2905690 RepID=A0ABZ2KL69_9BACT
MRVTSFLFSILVASSFVAVGCSSSEDPPTQGELKINFSNPQLAVVTQKLEIFVFPNGSDTQCNDLVTGRTATGKWRDVWTKSSQPFDTCTLVRAPSSVKVPEVNFGKVAVGVVGLGADGKDVMVGCSKLTLGSGSFAEPITLVPVDPNAAQKLINGTTCTALTKFCAGECQ